MPEWTKEQKNAIESRDGTILVSAAAGSGKTAVLVERVIQRLTDTNKPCPADRLLIVTFTRAATKQMKERIYRALSKKLQENPNDEYLKRQLMLLPRAHISTIDSFCNDLVKENYHTINLAPDYKLIEGVQLKLVETDAMNKMLDEMYMENSDSFINLANMLAASTDDSALSDLVRKLYFNSMAFSQPEKWLDSLADEYNYNGDFATSRWGRLIINHVDNMVDYCIAKVNQMQMVAESNDAVIENYGGNISEMMNLLVQVKTALASDNWDTIRNTILSISFSPLKRVPKNSTNDGTEYVKKQKKIVSEYINKKAPAFFCASQQENDDDMKYLKPIVEKLISSVKRYGEILNAEKMKLNSVDFSDISHFALKLLVDYDEKGNIVKTPLAKEFSSRFDEILVDEFQDINELQNTLFYAVSANDSNMFMVGDVKQSIYRFRQAMPEIFLGRRDSLEDYNKNNYPAKITLDRNFRSRKGVTENVNFVFSQIMSPELGGVDYSASEALVAAADYENCDFPQAELHIIGSMEDGGRVNRKIEAQHIADYINETIKSEIKVRDSDGYRKVTYRDFCILIRSASGGKAETYSSILADNNIPSYFDDKSGFFTASEVSTVINLMRVVDNPMQDIPLLAIMLSPIYGFTADELAQMRIDDRKAPLFKCVRMQAEKGNTKCIDFIENLDNLRMMGSTLPCSQFLLELYEETGFNSIVSAMKNGSSRKENLKLLVNYASKYEESGYRGLPGFIRFVDKIQKQNGDLESASDMAETADVVRIMTIHKSKGLEFPICIVADMSARFNDDNSKSVAAFHPDYGICFDIRRTERKLQYPTAGKKALALAEKRSSMSEELRVLYVAMTRAKEKLVCVTRYDDTHAKINDFVSMLYRSDRIDPFVLSERNSMADWIMLAFLRHPDAAKMRNELDIFDVDTLKCTETLEVQFIDKVGEPQQAEESATFDEADDDLIAEIKTRTEYVYPYLSLENIRAKSAPSEFDCNDFNTKFFAAAKPQFLSKSGINPASRGTATHKFMEFYDYSDDTADIVFQAQRMVEQGHLTKDEKDILEMPKIKKFFESEIAQRIRRSPLIMREKRVTVAISACKLYPDLPENVSDEKIVIQGFVDCAFEEDGELIIVDYKTDRGTTAEELKERYSTQLKMYEYALAQCTGKKIKGTLIYSFDNGNFISL